ncbi:MFS transporter [Streptomyces collinus]|uniref:MFS transporter n=1 Tax=Streptomyces collinus TaxID=42684 RepID=UPI00369234DA
MSPQKCAQSAHHASEPSAEGTSPLRRRLVLACCSTSIVIVILDFTALNVALPMIQRDLHTSVSGLQWILAAYGLVLCSLQMSAGAIGDRAGRRKTFRIGLCVFVLGSTLCAVAPTLEWLVLFRVLQGIGAAVLSPLSLSIIAGVFSGEAERARAIGTWSSASGIALAAGPLLGGAVVDSLGWRFVFWLSVLVALVALLLTRHVPESRMDPVRGADPVGQVLMAVFLAALVYVIIEGPGRGWGTPVILGCICVLVMALTALVPYELRHRHPLIDPRFFRSVPFTSAGLIAMGAVGAGAGFLFLSTLYLQDARHLTPLQTGLWLLPMTGMTVILAPLAGRLTATLGPRVPLLIAGAALTAGGLMYTVAGAETGSVPALMVAFGLNGIGYAIALTPVTQIVVSGLPPAQSGVAGGVIMTSRLVGQSLGIAVTGAFLSSALHSTTHRSPTAFAGASLPAWWIITACGATIVLLGTVATTPWARATARRTGLLFTDPASTPPNRRPDPQTARR